MIGLGSVVVGYIALGEYRKYEKRKALAKALNPASATGPRELLETLSTKSSTTGISAINTVTVPATAGLPSCAIAFPATPFLWPAFRIGERCV
jgi:hypothetical protein